jgi:hypothetical protein
MGILLIVGFLKKAGGDASDPWESQKWEKHPKRCSGKKVKK